MLSFIASFCDDSDAYRSGDACNSANEGSKESSSDGVDIHFRLTVLLGQRRRGGDAPASDDKSQKGRCRQSWVGKFEVAIRYRLRKSIGPIASESRFGFVQMCVATAKAKNPDDPFPHATRQFPGLERSPDRHRAAWGAEIRVSVRDHPLPSLG